MKVVSTKLPNPEWEALVDRCNEHGITMAEYLRELLRKDCGNIRPTIEPAAIPEPNSLGQTAENRRVTDQEKYVPTALSRMLGLDKKYR